MENTSSNFLKFPLTNRKAFSEIYEHKENLARCIQSFGNLLPEITVFGNKFLLEFWFEWFADFVFFRIFL